MAASLSDLRDQIRLDADIRGNPTFGDPRLLRMINLAQRYVQAQLNGLGFKKWETSKNVTLFNGSFGGISIKKFGINALSNMLESPRSIFMIEVNDGSSYGVAYPRDPIEFKEDITNKYSLPSIKDSIFIRLANNILLSPAMIANATAYYYKAINDLSESTLSITSVAVSSEDGLGDVDGDGIITKNDSELILQYVLGNITLTAAQITAADMDVSGTATAADAAAVLAILGKVVNELGWITIGTATDHGLTDGDVIEISDVVGMTDLNTTFQVTVPSPNKLIVPLATTQTYISGGTIQAYSQIPMEFEDFVIRKVVLDVNAINNKLSDKTNAMTALDNDLTKVFEKFYGTIQNEDFNKKAGKAKLQ